MNLRHQKSSKMDPQCFAHTLGRSKVEEGEEKSNFHNPTILCPALGHTICTTAEAIQSVTVRLWREQRARMSASHIHRAAHCAGEAYRV